MIQYGLRWMVLLLPMVANARWMTVQEAGSVVENFSTEYTIFKSGASDQLVDYTLRVQSEDAKVNASLFTIDYNSFTDKVEILEAFTQNGKEKIAVDPSAIEDRDKGKAKDYDALKTRSVAFPQVEIGSKLHIRYILHTAKALLQDRWSLEISLAPGVVIETASVKIKSELPLYTTVRDPERVVSLRQKDKFNILINNKNKLMAGFTRRKDPFFYPDRAGIVYVSTHKNWAEYFANIDKEYAGVVDGPLPKNLDFLVRTASGLGSAREQIFFLMDRMSRDFRYFGDWRRHNGGLIPRSLVEIEKSRYGDCKDLASLLAAMLRKLKIHANVALVRRGENPWGQEPDYELPVVNRFNHAIVQVQLGNETLWLDATNPVASLEPLPDIAGRPAWVLEPGAGHFDRLPPAQAQNYIHQREYEYHFRGSDEVKVRVSAEMKHMAAYRTSNDLLLSSRSEVLSDTLEFLSEGQEVRGFKYVKEPATTRIFGDMKIVLEYDTGRVTFDAGKDGFYVIPDGFLTGAFYETDDRESDMRISEAPFSFHGVRRLKDVHLAQAMPDPCQVKSDWMDLERRIEAQGNDVVIFQNIELKRPYISRDEFRSGAFKKLQAATKECFYRSGILIGARKGSL